MIYASIDNPTTKNITGYETGTRADFDKRHGHDPLWIFLDYDLIKYHVVTGLFLQYPQHYYINANNDIVKHPSS